MKAKVLSSEAAVVQMPGRRFPGVVLQGDTIGSWSMRIQQITEIAEKIADPKLFALCNTLKQQITSARDDYNRVCAQSGMSGV
jgi:hypothetical protein